MTHYATEIPSRNRLYRNKDRGLIGGVCAGISDWLGLNLTALRVIVVVLAIPFTPVILIGYVLLWILLPKRPVQSVSGSEGRKHSGRKYDARPLTPFPASTAVSASSMDASSGWRPG